MMKISMWIIADELSDLNLTENIVTGDMVLEDFRILSQTQVTEGKYVYISCGKSNIQLINGEDIININNIDIFTLINYLCAVFEKYRNWDSELHEASNNSVTPLQAIINTAHNVFQCPMFFGRIDRRIYALTNQYSKDEVYEEWDEVKELHSMTFELNKRLLGFFDTNRDIAKQQDLKQVIEPVWEGMKFCHQIRTNCYLDGAIWGHFYIYYKKQDISPAVLQLAQHVGKIFEKWIAESSVKTSPNYFKHSWLIDVLNGSCPNEEAIKTLYYSLGWKMDEKIILYRLDTGNDSYDRMMFFWLCDSIDSLSKAVVFPYGHSIVVLVHDNGKQPKFVLDGIRNLLSSNYFQCGVSFPFVGLYKLRTFFRQAGYALEYAPHNGDKIHYYKDCVLEGIVAELRSADVEWRDWVLPSLLKIMADDRESGRDYATTLYKYLLYNNIADTSREMHIHRNTLVYRLDKIRQEIKLELNDSRTSAYLLLCFMLLNK